MMDELTDYDGLMDLVLSKDCWLSNLDEPSENAGWLNRVWNPRGQLSAALVNIPISHIDYHNQISQLKKH